MDPNAAAWPGELSGQLPGLENGQNGEDWEEWLRWDPAGEPTSPGDGTLNSSSSKNDSPLQAPPLPVPEELFAKGAPHDTMTPPFVVGEDTFDFAGAPMASGDPFRFGTSDAAASAFDFNTTAAPAQPPHPDMPKVDTNWPMLAHAPAENVTLSALSTENDQQLPAAPSAGTPSLHRSPESRSQLRTSLSNSGSPEAAPKKRGGRKRKVDVEPEPREESGEWQDGDEPPIKKTTHNVIEKRYRNNLNDRIVELRNSVPSLRAMGRANCGEESEDLEGLTPAHKLNKATVMAKATEYIRHLERRNKVMSDETAHLKARLMAVEQAIGKNRDRQASLSNSPPSGTSRSRQTSSSSQHSAASFLGAPQEQTRYGQPIMQQPYVQQQQRPVYTRPSNPPAEAQDQPQYVYGRGGGMVNKVMMGAMAGIMVMEGLSEQSQDDTHGLFAVPVMSQRAVAEMPPVSSPAALARHTALPLLKIFCVIGALLYLIAPLLDFSPRQKQKTHPVVRLPQVPSLASPVEVRRKAWLTAMQTVYVPKHFLLEVAAVTSKMFKLSLRRLVGPDLWIALVGINKEEEAACVKAWDIAIDAQLAGGDAEVSYYRLLLTLMASGTLPDSPTRLMQKAVHFRVFFWEVANAGYGNIFGFKQFTEKVGKIYWDLARKLQKELVFAKAQGRLAEEDEGELLPDHLASLLELDCDEVLGDEMIQRAWNLAWNKPSAHRTTANAARDSVIEDHAIRSPLDAVAAWYANMTIDDTLLETLGKHPSYINIEYYLGLAVSISPPASATQVRALTAKAVLSNTNREANIITALEALPVTSPGAGTMNLVNHAPAAPDVHQALTMAKLLSLLTPSAPASALNRAYETIASLYLPASNFTLLTGVAAYRLLQRSINGDRLRIPQSTAHGLEDIAADLRVWIGTSAGRKAGLSHEDCSQVVDLCLHVTKKVGGWDERDSGYGSVETSPVRTRGELMGF